MIGDFSITCTAYQVIRLVSTATFVWKMKLRLLSAVLVLMCVTASGRTKDDTMSMRHEIKVGWADQLFEQMFWRNEMPYVMSESQSRVYKQNYRYNQHYWLDYQCSFAPWFSAGMLVDHSSVHWDNVTINGAGQELDRVPNQRFYNLIMMPSMRVTYMHRPHVEIYSELGLGFDLNGGTEKNEKGRRTSLGYGYDFRPVGVRFNSGRFFTAADFGRTFALRDSDHVFLAMGRIISVSVGFSFGLPERESSSGGWSRRKNKSASGSADGDYVPFEGYSSHYFGFEEEQMP